MTQVAIEAQGINKLARTLKKAGEEELVEGVTSANLEIADTIADAARPLTPKRSGKLVNTLRTSATARMGVVRVGTKKVPYAKPIHFGWKARNIKPQPFLYTALDRKKQEALATYNERIADVCALFDSKGGD